jgi:hypothetical protein
MDYGVAGIGQGIDLRIVVKFAGTQLATRVTTVRGKELLHAEVNEQVRVCAERGLAYIEMRKCVSLGLSTVTEEQQVYYRT